MIPLEIFKDSLGNDINNLNEEEILKLRDNQDQMAEILFHLWLDEISKKDTL